jgi:hypothetical protein
MITIKKERPYKNGSIKRMVLMKKKIFKSYKPIEKIKKTKQSADPSDVS